MCEVRVDTISYAGAGNSTTKKEAQLNAAKDFVNYLVRTGLVLATDVPEDSRGGAAVKEEDDNQGSENAGHQQQRAVFQVGVISTKLLKSSFFFI